MLQISELYIYPIKSLAGIAVKKVLVTPTGFEHDRRWLLVDKNNRFMTQREFHQMALLQVAIEETGLKVTHKLSSESLFIPFNTDRDAYEQVLVTIWDDTCIAEFVSAEVDKWFTSVLDIQCRLVYMPGSTRRIVDQRYAPGDALTSFADAYPFLIIGQASLDDLNSRLTEALPMNRFRPNIVFTGGRPFDEDLYGHFIIGDINFFGVKLCARCVMTTVNQDTAVKAKEPLKTLSRYRFKDNKILFGQNLVHQGAGEISIGDHMVVLRQNIEERFLV